MAWDGAPSEEELHAEFLDWIWEHATPVERGAILRERIRAARLRGDPRCPDCGGQRRSACPVCAGAGFAEPAALRSTIHDYFFAKALRLVRPGGLVVFLTSWGTLDKQAKAVRSFLAEQATLFG
jgi:adenine-specific DNA methylase